MTQHFLQDCIKRFQYYKTLGDQTFAQISDDAYNYSPNEASNNIAIIVQHLHGNMLSRWTNFLTEDGEKPWRKRDNEFENPLISKAQVLELWEEGWACLFSTLQSLTPEDLSKTIYIRTEPLQVYDAILRQLAHYPYHVGQIVYLGRATKNTDWKSLSIPKGKGNSEQYNQQLQQATQTQ